MTKAIHRHFERQNPVRFELARLTVKTYPPKKHPLDWDAFKVRMNINDLTKTVHGLPAIEIDVAAPEQLLPSSVIEIDVGGHRVTAYAMERIVGEKLRAFLQHLPTYRSKLKRPGESVRARDLYDIARILRVHPIAEVRFWNLVGQEFKTACRFRYVDCAGLASFHEAWDVTRKTYEESVIPKDVPFAEAETGLAAIVAFLEKQGILPLTFPLASPSPLPTHAEVEL